MTLMLAKHCALTTPGVLSLLQPQALTVLDSDPWVETYAWFTIFTSSSSWLGGWRQK